MAENKSRAINSNFHKERHFYQPLAGWSSGGWNSSLLLGTFRSFTIFKACYLKNLCLHFKKIKIYPKFKKIQKKIQKIQKDSKFSVLQFFLKIFKKIQKI